MSAHSTLARNARWIALGLIANEIVAAILCVTLVPVLLDHIAHNPAATALLHTFMR